MSPRQRARVPAARAALDIPQPARATGLAPYPSGHTGAGARDRYNGRFRFLSSPSPHVALFHYRRAARVRSRRVARSRGFLAGSRRACRPDRPQRRGQVVAAEDRRRAREARRRAGHAPAGARDRLCAAGA